MLSETCCSKAEQSLEKFSNSSKKSFTGIPDKSPIINGVLAGERDFLYIAALRVHKNPRPQYGSGSIVRSLDGSNSGSEWIITARHNIIDINTTFVEPFLVYYPLIVFPKYSNRDQDIIRKPNYYIKNTYCHPWPKSQKNPNNDIALIELQKKIPLNQPPYLFQSVPLVDKNFDINSWPMVKIAGWGYNQTKPKMLPDNLMKADIPLIPPQYCRQFYPGFESEKKFCAGQNRGGVVTTSCNGDSGGPAVIVKDGQEYLAGVIVGGDQYCFSPSVSMKVAHYRDWIDEVMTSRPSKYYCQDLLKNRPN
ncbi:trypsin-3-like [Brevipalpus obovatus]|uniref:trypsin-3-like n=1 Tax=Brevipalpus obovatus TaxID=246614 RepID=UPI003D9EF269